MRKPLPFTDTKTFAQSLNRIDALQVYYDNFFHEIQSNITPIVYNCDMAINGTKVEENLQAIKSTAQYTLRIIDKMSQAIRLDLSGMKVNTSTFELCPWLETFVSDYHTMSRANDEDDEVVLCVSHGLRHASIESDALMLMQVIYTLLHNAFKFSDEGTPVKLKCKELNDQLVIEVHNIGTISAKNRERLFVPYLKAESEIPDSGFGLYLCSLYVEALNGVINASCENNVTVFSIFLPNVIQCEYNNRA